MFPKHHSLELLKNANWDKVDLYTEAQLSQVICWTPYCPKIGFSEKLLHPQALLKRWPQAVLFPALQSLNHCGLPLEGTWPVNSQCTLIQNDLGKNSIQKPAQLDNQLGKLDPKRGREGGHMWEGHWHVSSEQKLTLAKWLHRKTSICTSIHHLHNEYLSRVSYFRCWEYCM